MRVWLRVLTLEEVGVGMFDDEPFKGYTNDTEEERGRIGKPYCQLVGLDGNAFAIMGRVDHALKRAGYSKEARQQYQDDSTSGDYNHLLGVAMDWTTEDKDEEEGD